MLQDCPEIPEEVSLTFNIDGLEICKSKSTNFSLIVCRVKIVENVPFVLSVFFAHSKPTDPKDLLSGFLDETKM
ncbi:hypothetical protein HPB48_026834 [Haemaphysalis longicornis]|uniref:Uncharacterized protein n=1 Tax=Haemaphysalis longicornis TaxID=44386 RepID=A0A9J6HD72_HAELO|nr:hypothetical protein HPB48_026834 [Haemaphysalis longicornis]